MGKLDLGNLNSILENLKESENNIKNILEEQNSTLFHTKDYYEGELEAYKNAVMMLSIYLEKQKRNNEKKCNKCGGTDLFIEIEGNRRGLYCGKCGKWQKWITKDELQIAKFRNLKIIKEQK